jgi:hypothetical protein
MLGIPEWQLEAAEAVGTNVLDDIVADSRRSWTIQAKPSPEPVRGSGWVEPAPLQSPPGQRWIDMLMDEQDRQDKLDRIAAEAQRRKTLAELAPPELKAEPKADEGTPRAPATRPTKTDK